MPADELVEGVLYPACIAGNIEENTVTFNMFGSVEVGRSLNPVSKIIGTIKGNLHVMSGNLKMKKTSGRVEEQRERSAPYDASRRNSNARENQHIQFLFPTVGSTSLTYPESRCSWKTLVFPWPAGAPITTCFITLKHLRVVELLVQEEVDFSEEGIWVDLHVGTLSDFPHS